jgi:cellulose biosynthesis protein BcsQ
VLDPVIPERSAVQQAQGAGVPVQAWRSPGAAEVSDAFDDILDRLLA